MATNEGIPDGNVERLKSQKAKACQQPESTPSTPADALTDWAKKGRGWAVERGDYETIVKLADAVAHLDSVSAEHNDVREQTDYTSAMRKRHARETADQALRALGQDVRRVLARSGIPTSLMESPRNFVAFARGASEVLHEIEPQLSTS